jgi:K+-sensing histidine kinase KdpD
MTIPVASGIAILRHRLYDIDLIINRTLVYGVLTAILGLFYLGLVLVLQQIAISVTAESDLAVAGSTLVVAALFRPLRSRVQGFIDRRFYRRKYDAVKTLEQFSQRMRDELNLESLTRELMDVINRTMEPSQVSVWLRASSTNEGAPTGADAIS